MLTMVTNFFKKHLYLIIGFFLSLCLLLGIWFYYSPVDPIIKITSNDSFIGNKALIEGQIVANCNCFRKVFYNNKELQLTQDGGFKIEIDTDAKQDELSYQIDASTKGKWLNFISKSSFYNSKLKRTPAKLDFTTPILEWGEKNLDLSLNGIENSNIVITAISIKNKPDGRNESEITKKDSVTNETGILTVNIPFDINYDTQEVKYLIKSNKEGYSDYEFSFNIKNTKYDSERVLKEKTQWEEEQRIQKIIDEMNIYSGNGGLRVAVLPSEIKKSRTIDYYYVLDPANYQYVSIPVSIQNSGTESYLVSANYVSIIDKSGNTYSIETPTYSYTNYLNASSLQPSANTVGWVVFILPKAEKEFTLVYDDYSHVVKKDIYIK
jgi:hypothetical protein